MDTTETAARSEPAAPGRRRGRGPSGTPPDPPPARAARAPDVPESGGAPPATPCGGPWRRSRAPQGEKHVALDPRRRHPTFRREPSKASMGVTRPTWKGRTGSGATPLGIPAPAHVTVTSEPLELHLFHIWTSPRSQSPCIQARHIRHVDGCVHGWVARARVAGSPHPPQVRAGRDVTSRDCVVL